MRRPTLSLLLLLVLLPLPALAQAPSADWRTISTPHFRVHYPAPSEEWARRAAARLESIRERVVEEVGYAPPEVVDVLVSDPAADANGQAFPFLGWPRMILWTSPPGPQSVIGHYTDWSELLVVHEETHLVHLLRPSRNPLRRALARAVPLSPITLGAPRWVTEGYATVVEGRLTGSGRPNGDLRAAILRRWAQGGKLPSYGRLAGDESWMGMSMAYLVGSAYLEWLEERAGPGSLRNLWARMTARTARSFDDAFEGIFGDSPSDLYDRFRAEVTWRALEAERLVEPAKREGPLWQDLSWNVGSPVVSPDGLRLAIVLDRRDEPAELTVFSTAPDEEAEKEWEKRREEARKRDPEDVPAVRTAPVARKRLHTLKTRDGVEPTMPRWMPDGKSLLFVRFEPDSQGFLHPDLFSWTLETGEIRRITREADLRDPDPAPDGTWAVAVRNRHGLSQIVRVELSTGAVSDLTAPTVSEVYDQPRLSPDGTRAAFALHREGAWRIAVLDVAGGTTAELAPPPGGTVSSPVWSPDGRSLYAVVGLEGFIDLWSFPLDPAGAPVPVTRTQGAAIAPAPAPDGSGLYYLTLEPDGLDLRRLPLPVAETAAAAPPDVPASLAPVVRPAAPPAPEPFPEGEVSESRPYGLGRQEFFPLLGGSAASGGGAWELGLRGGDVVGRFDGFVLGSLGSDGWPTGGALAGAWRGLPLALGFHLFQSEERPGEGSNVPERGNLLDLDRRGIELSAQWDRIRSGDRLRLTGAVLWNEIELERGPFTQRLDQRVASLTAGWGSLRRRGSWWIDPGLTAQFDAGSTDGEDWTRAGGALWLGITHDDTRLRLTWSRDTSEDVTRAFDLYQLGGARTTLLPDTAMASRIAVPALPPGTLLGEEHEGQRAELTLGFLPAPLFYERHRLWSSGQAKGGWLTLAGLEYRLALEPLPIGRLPGLDLRVGVAQVLEEPFAEELLEGDLRWWLITVWRP